MTVRTVIGVLLLGLAACGPTAAPVATDDAAAVAAAERKAVADTDAAFRDAAAPAPTEPNSGGAG